VLSASKDNLGIAVVNPASNYFARILPGVTAEAVERQGTGRLDTAFFRAALGRCLQGILLLLLTFMFV
jgi:hypothetical protein